MTPNPEAISIIKALPRLQSEELTEDLRVAFGELDPEAEARLTVGELTRLLEGLSACVSALATIRNAALGAALSNELFAAQAAAESTGAMIRALQAINSTMSGVASRLSVQHGR